MFASKAAKPQTKAAASSASNLAHQRSTLLAHRSGSCSAEQVLFLQRTIGNQATRRYLTQRLSNLPATPPGESRVQSPTAAPGRLAIGSVDDPLEHEADAIADTVMHMPAGEADGKRNSSTVSVKSGPADVHRKPLASNSVSSSHSPAHVQDAIGSGGQKLDRATRNFFEPRLGYNLNSVRIYTGSRAAESAQAIDAKAYTLGNNIVFGTGQYRPETDAGKQLLAHELAHAVQSGSSSNVRRDTIYRQPDAGSAQLAAIEYEIQMLNAMPVKVPPVMVRLAELYEERKQLLARRASYSTPAPTRPTQSPARAAAEQAFEATFGKENLPVFNEAMDRVEEVTEAHRVYMTTGQIPQTKSSFMAIEIKEGRLMTRAERYDAMVRKLGMGKTIAQIDDITYDNRDPEYLTQEEFKEEYWARYHAERDNCYDEYFWPKYERQCIRRVQEKYGGESFIAWREGRERELAYRIEVAKAQIENVASSGAIGTLGRASGYIAARISGHDEQEALEWSEHAAAIGGVGDFFLGVKAGVTARAKTQNYSAGGGHVVSRDAPITPPPQNVAAPPKNEPSSTPGSTSPSASAAVTDPWAGSVQRRLDLSKNLQNEPIVLAQPSKPLTTAAPQTPAPRLSANEVKQDLLGTIKEVNNLPESNLKASTLKELRDLLKKTNALEQAEKKGTDVSGSLNEIDRRHVALDDKVADAVVRSNESRVPKPAPRPPKPGEVRNPSVPTATKPSGSVRWIEDEPAMSDYARKYEHGATGARSKVASKRGQVPALDWVKPGGTTGQVKFDGIDDTVLVDRKVSVTTFESSRDQALRQSEALRQNGYTGRWEVPDLKEKAVAEKMFTDLGITNITVKVEPTK